MLKGAKFNNPSKQEKKLIGSHVKETWEDGTILLPGPPPRRISGLKDLPMQGYQIISRVNLLLQRVSVLESRVIELESQLRKRKEK